MPADVPVLDLYARSAVLMDGDTGRVLYEKDGYSILPMASTTKIMTCILALENGNPDDMLTVSSYAASMPKVHLGVRSGERYRMEDLLYSLMLESHNDSAVVIAEGIGGSVEGFAQMMNQKARDIGAYDTFFVTPNGLDATAMCEGPDGRAAERAHSTTAADLARILRYCIVESPKREEFLAITGADSHQFCDGDGKRSFGCYNHNAFLNMMEGALTGKTGFTGNAGYCYVGAVKQGEELYIVALLACGWPNNKGYKWSDMKTLVNYGLEHYEVRDVWREPELTEIPVTDGIPWDGSPDGEACVALRPDYKDGEAGLMLLLREDEEVVMTVAAKDSLKAPAPAGTVAGTVTYTLNGEIVKSYNLVTVRAVEKRDFQWYARYVWQLAFGGHW
ncbi:MAG: D-alanyl-D-alanine carboxypeptidase [Lachnospiraceae bacterium]|nr:D-alanyl-D-alanine carboxypeptidase [Lachnospiraceae bacterium]